MFIYLFVGSALAQILYLLFLLKGIFKKYPQSSDLKPVSVVVAAHNEFNNLHHLLPRLIDQKYPDYEIIVVDDRSTDNTSSLIQNFATVRWIAIEETQAEVNPKKYALEQGIKAARNPMILLTDADCVPASKYWIRSMASHYSENVDIVLGFGGYEKESSFLNYFIQYETLITAFLYIGWAGLGKPYMGVGRNLSYKKQIFFKNEGFNKNRATVGGDDDLFINQVARKKNCAVAIGKKALTLSKPKRNYADFFIQKLRHLSVGPKYSLSNKIRLSVFTLTHIIFWISFFLSLFYQSELYFYTIGFLFTRLIILWVVIAIAGKRFGYSIINLLTPLLDFCYTFYYIFVGSAALFVRKVRWN